jgi:serine/threonine protein kinase
MTKYPDTVATCPADGGLLVSEEHFAHIDKDLAAGDVVGEYRIEGKLGQGGFGAVFSAVHPVIGKHAAIKVLSRQFSSNPQMVSRFIAEARAVNQIRHRNIIDIFAFGQLPDGRQYYVMELLDGMPFDKYLASHERLTIGQALPILRGITRALDAAHAKNILHRDLKPENVFLVFDEDGGVQAKLLDFGLVKLLSADGSGGGEHKTKTGTPMGTPYYMSPEQCRGKDVDRGTDIYAFGALVFEVLTGKVPFNGESAMDVLMKHIMEDAPRASVVCPQVPLQLDAPILRMLAKEPSGRPASVGEALAALVEAGNAAGALSGASVLPPPSDPVITGEAYHALATVPTMDSDGAAKPIRVVSGGEEASPHGNTFLASEADVRTDAPARRSRARTGAIAVALLGVLAAGAFVFALQHRSSDNGPTAALVPSTGASAVTPSAVVSTPSTATGATGATGAAVVEAKVEDVEIRIEGAPKGAIVKDGPRELGAAPGPFTLRAGSPVTLTIVAKGYKPRELPLSPTASTSVQVTLDKQPAAVVKTGPKGQAVNKELEGFDPK